MEDSVKNQLNDLLSKVNLEEVTATDNSGFVPLPDGYYLAEVVKADLTETKQTHLPMVSFQFKNVDDGIDIKFDNNDNPLPTKLENTKGRYQFVNFVLKDDSSIKRFVSNMLKFEGDEEGVPLLDKDYFTNSEILGDALNVLIGKRIVLNVSTSEKKDGTTSTWTNLLTWKRVRVLELPF